MAVTNVIKPNLYASCYRPIEWGFASDRSPTNTIGGESFLAVSAIRQPDAADIAAFPTLEETDLLVIHAPLSNTAVGDYVSITNSTNLLYDGEWRVQKVVAVTHTVISAPYVGDDVFALLSKVYRNFTLTARVTPYNESTPISVRLKPDINTGFFVLDAQDIMARTMNSVFDNVTPGLGVRSIEQNGAICQAYDVEIFEGWDEPNADGVLEFSSKPGSVFSAKNYNAVNAVQPYVHTDADGTVDMTYTSELFSISGRDWVVQDADIGAANLNRLLTWAPVTASLRGQVADYSRVKVGADDEYFVSFLTFDGTAGQSGWIRLVKYQSDGTFIGSEFIQISFPQKCGTIAVGPANMEAEGISLSGVGYYSISLTNFNQSAITLPVTVTIDRECSEGSETMYWLNKMGGIDTYRFNYRTSRLNQASRQTIKKPVIKIGGNDWNRRTIRVDPYRVYQVKSELEPKEVFRWLADDLFESPDVRVMTGGMWGYVNVETTETVAEQEIPTKKARVTLDYTLGHDNRSQKV